MLHFLREVHEHDPVVRSNERAILSLPNSNLTYELLTSGLTHKLQVFIGKVDGKTENFARRLREPTEEVIFVISGVLTVGLDSGDYTLQTGDSICFEGYQLKSLSTSGPANETSWISIITPPAF
jgi:mannose-6-phosphate isomerase-like protein (cupin superfamily)